MMKSQASKFLFENYQECLLRDSLGSFKVDCRVKDLLCYDQTLPEHLQTHKALPGSLSERCGCWHSEGYLTLLLVLSVLQKPCDWSDLRRCHTQDTEETDGERGQSSTFRKHS